MKRALMFSLLLAPFIGNAATIAPVALTWHVPTTQVNGTALPVSDIAKHTVKCGLEPGKYTLQKDVAMPGARATTDFAAHGKDGYRYCVVTATNKAGEESAPSPEIRFFALAGQVMPDKPNRFASVQSEK
jgi:hypothetical protein